MKFNGLVFAVLFFSLNSWAQVEQFCLPLHKQANPEQVKARIDSLYQQAGYLMSGDSIGIAWYKGFRPAFEKYIASADLPWDTTTNVWIDLCCLPSGEIERTLYSSKGFTDPILEKRFSEALQSFASTYVFPLRASKRFSQCGTLRFGAKK